jgi:hypothetical protein
MRFGREIANCPSEQYDLTPPVWQADGTFPSKLSGHNASLRKRGTLSRNAIDSRPLRKATEAAASPRNCRYRDCEDRAGREDGLLSGAILR